jgi:hypothetical protein
MDRVLALKDGKLVEQPMERTPPAAKPRAPRRPR